LTFSAYGWGNYTPEMTDAEILKRLLKLNLARRNPNPSVEMLQPEKIS
jgi:hypothetical protein